MKRGYAGASLLANCVLALPLLFGPGPAFAVARILALGDSITAGYGLPPDEALAVRLEQRIKADGFDVTVINGGVTGDTTAGGLARLDSALQDKPQYALVALGANDSLRGLDPAQAYDNLDKILARLEAAGLKVLLVGMRALNDWGRDYEAKFDAIYPQLAAKYRVPLYPFLLEGVVLNPKLNQPDGLHPNVAGVAVIVERIAPAVEAMLGADAKTR